MLSIKGKSIDRYKIGIICMFQILERLKCHPRPRAVKLPLFDRETSLTLPRHNRGQFIWLRRVWVRAKLWLFCKSTDHERVCTCRFWCWQHSVYYMMCIRSNQ